MSHTVHTTYARTSAEADERANTWKHRDPFTSIKPALLSAEHIAAYVMQTAMLHPIDLTQKGTLKGASCEIMPGEYFIRWEGGKKVINKISDTKEIILPANSIVFVQIAVRIRLPDYIAIRFNLRIAHVHRGLLLGTGPLVDPAFRGDLLIPLHNLTDSEYRIPAKKGLIWIEFTKTSRRTPEDLDLDPQKFETEIFRPSDKDLPTIEFYFEKANHNRPIESSIPGEVSKAKEDALKALATAEDAKKTNQVFASIGFLAVLGALVGLVSFLQGANARVDGVTSRLDAAMKANADATATAAALRLDLERALAELHREREAATNRDRAFEVLQQRMDDFAAKGTAPANAGRLGGRQPPGTHR